MSDRLVSLSDYLDNVPSLDALVRKYSVAGPRYTSYPTAVEFNDSVGNKEWREILQQDSLQNHGEKDGQSSGLSVYVHIPFCDSLCYFCACNKVITKDKTAADKYITALAKEIATYRELLGSGIPVEEIHWGGGSPNFLTPKQIRALHETVLAGFGQLVPDAEISVEIDPRTTTDEHLETFAELGFNRLSLGVQDFTLEVQQLINRVQSYDLTKHVCDTARGAGLKNINIDLIYGLPLQTVQGFSETIDQVVELAPSRVAMYGYAHVTWKKKIQKTLERSHLPTPNERIALFTEGLRKFTNSGYTHIGLDHFALPGDTLSEALQNGRLNRTFMGYTAHRGSRVLAFGASSISLLPQAFGQNTKDLKTYEQRIEQEGLAIERGLIRTPSDQLRGEIIQAILCQGKLNIPQIESNWGISFHDEFAQSLEALQPMVADSLLMVSDEVIQLTPLGRLFARNVAMVFDEYLQKHREQEKPVFSQAV